MALPLVVAIVPGSPAELAGVRVGDVLMAINGEQPRDVIRYQLLVDEAEVTLELDRSGIERTIEVQKADGAALGLEVQSSLFDQVRTCDNHCSFCFIYQLPPGMRKSLSLKDDDFRLSFLYGNFTTLTRFTEADLERVITEGLSPLYVSIHSTDPEVRSAMLRNRRGATSLRWLRALLDHGIEIHGQLVICPGINGGEELEKSLAGVFDEYPELVSMAVVPLGISDHSNEPDMRAHTQAEAEEVIDLVETWQKIYLRHLGRRLVFASDEYYLLAKRPFPEAEVYEGFPMHEDGIGMARTFEFEFTGQTDQATGTKSGFFSWVEGAPAEGYRAPRVDSAAGDVSSLESCGTNEVATAAAPPVLVPLSGSSGTPVQLRPRRSAPVGILTGAYGAQILQPLIDSLERDDVRIIEVPNRFFGGNIGVTGLMVGEDVDRVLASQPAGHRYLLPDVCLSSGIFLDGGRPEDLSQPVEIIATDGIALRRALEFSITTRLEVSA